MASIVHPRETVKAAIRESAAAVTSFILIRAAISNRSWKTPTRRVARDSIITGDGCHFSSRDNGVIGRKT
ncbi:MAG TPA: hypothetical protein VMM54_11815 [Nitrospirota bacterium]|nr:hypothetical protein [Nitrospirota bacterium]